MKPCNVLVVAIRWRNMNNNFLTTVTKIFFTLHIMKRIYLCASKNERRWRFRYNKNKNICKYYAREPYWQVVIPEAKKKKTKRNSTHFKSFPLNGKKLGSSATSQIESVLSSFVLWLFHNRLRYNSTHSCIPYAYVPATSTCGRVNTISRHVHVACISYEEYIMLSAYRSHRDIYRLTFHSAKTLEFMNFRDLLRDQPRC